MAKRGERYCIVCGTKYEYCPNCGKGNIQDTWKFNYDTEECRDIFKVCSAYAFGHISAEEAKHKLSKYNLSDTSRFKEDIRRNISAINATNKETEEETSEPAEKVVSISSEDDMTSEINTVAENTAVKEPQKTYNSFGYSKKNKHNNTKFVNK